MGLSKCSIDITEVAAVILECRKCGSSISYPLNLVPRGHYAEECPYCHHGSEDKTQNDILGDFRTKLTVLLEHYKNSPFSIRLEIKSDDREQGQRQE